MFRSERRFNIKSSLIFLLLAFFVLSFAACSDQANDPSLLVLTAGTDELLADGKSATQIRATVYDSLEEPVKKDTNVRFKTNLGTFRNGKQEYRVQTLDDTGTVSVQLHAGTETGTAQVTAIARGVKQKINVRFIDPSKAYSVDLIPGSDAIVADGNSYVGVVLTVRGPAEGTIEGDPVEGLVANFSTTLGKFSLGNPADLEKQVGRTIYSTLTKKTASVATDVDGEAKVWLVSGTTSGIATITAEVSGLVLTAEVQFRAGKPVAMELRAAPQTIRPGGTTRVIAKILDAHDNPVEGELVAFEVFQNESGGVLELLDAETDINGEATVNYVTGSGEGTDRIRARCVSDNLIYDITDIIIDRHAIVIDEVVVIAGTESLPADGISSTVIRATVKDIDGNPASGVPVEFRTTLGTFSGGSKTLTVQTDGNGIAQVMLRSVTSAGIAKVSANASGFIDTVEVAFIGTAAQAITLDAAPSSVGPNGSSTLMATLTDEFGNPVEGARVNFGFVENTTGGSLSASSAETDGSGVATITYTAGSVTGSDRIRARSASNLSVADDCIIWVSIATDPVSSVIGALTLTASNQEIVADGSSNAAIRARVTNIDGVPIRGKTVSFAATYGVLSAFSANTNSEGIAEVLLTSELNAGLSLVSASIAEGHSDQVLVRFIPGPPDNDHSSITVQPGVIPADGISEAVVTVTLADENGNPVLNGTEVFLYTSSGTIISDNPASTVSGRAEFTVQAPLSPGVASISLWDYPDIDAASLAFGTLSPGVPAGLVIESVSHTEIAVTGVGKNDKSAVLVRVVDIFGNTVIDDANITLHVSLLAKPQGGEYLSGETAGGPDTDHQQLEIITNDGFGNFNLTSGVLPGAVEIRIEVYDAGVPLERPVITVAPQISIASGPPHTMVLSAPTLNAVVNLNDGPDSGIPQTPGFYSRKAGLIVTDQYGNAVPDGTVINLGMLDSVIARGSTGITSADDSFLQDNSTDFINASVLRGTVRTIQPNDRVVLFDVSPADKSRFVASPIGSASFLNVTKAYKDSAVGIKYAVGASLLGGVIYGTDGTTATKGTVQTENGLAQLRIVYPANRDKILVGCYPDPETDTRHLPAGSARVISVFTSTDDVSMVDEGTLCFASIAGWTLTAVPESLSLGANENHSVTLTLEDGGDKVRLPFIPVSHSVFSEDGVTLNVVTSLTDANGRSTSTVTEAGGVGGDATITYYAGDAKVEVEVTVTIPE